LDIRTAIQDYITAHEIQNSSAFTLVNYRKHLRYFADWLWSAHGISDTDNIQLTHLRGWMSYLQKTPTRLGRKRGDATINRYGMSMLAFLHWLEKEEVIQKPITTRFKLPRVEQKFIPTFTPGDIEKLLAACEEGDEHKPRLRKALTARNRAIVTILIDAGLRRSEIVGLRLCDIDRELRLLVVHRKGNKWQQVPVSRDGFKPLHEYLMKHRPYLAKLGGSTVARKEDAVFLSARGEPFTAGALSLLFKRLKRRTGIDDKRVSAHNCRRYMATTQLAMGRSPLDVQRQMGHTTLKMTNHYYSQTVEQLHRSQEAYSPLYIKKSKGDAGSGATGYWDE
jgi:site-specific recombinase XerD